MIDKPVPARTTQKPLDQLIPDSASYAKDEEILAPVVRVSQVVDAETISSDLTGY